MKMTNQEIIKEAVRIIELNSRDPKDPKYQECYGWALHIMPTLINHLTYDLKEATDRIKWLEGRLEHHNLSHRNLDDYDR